MRKYLALFLLLLPSALFGQAQGSFFSGTVQTQSGLRGGATVTVCSTAVIANSPTGATESGNTVTITTNSPHGFVAGQVVQITGITQTLYNGTFTILTVPTNSSFTYTNSNAGLSASGQGAVLPTNVPCTPTVSIFSDIGLTAAKTNPITTDGLGNFSFYAVSGLYVYTVTGQGILASTGGPFTFQLPCIAGQTCVTTNGNNAFTNSNSFAGSFSLTGGGAVNLASAGQFFNDWQPLQRTGGLVYKNTAPVVGSTSVSASSDIVLMPNLTGAVNAGAAQEMDAILVYPNMTRPSSGTSGPTYSGMAIAAPNDAGGTTKFNDSATLRIESNPAVATCNNLNGSSVPACWSLAVDAGSSKFGGNLYMAGNNVGLNMLSGVAASDLPINNQDSASATITHYIGGAQRFRISNTQAIFAVTPVPTTAGSQGLGTASLPFLNFFIGNAATNNAGITGTFGQATVLTLPDPGGAAASFAYKNAAQSWSGNQTNLALVTPTIGGGTTITKYYVVAGAITPAATNANTCAEQTFTPAAFNGVINAGDNIFLNGSATMAANGVFPVMSVRAVANGVAITYCNSTAGNLTAPAVTITVTGTR